MEGLKNHTFRLQARVAGLALLLGLGLPLRAMDQVVGDSPLQYGSLPDIGTLQKNVDALNKGQRSILQDSADAHGMQVVPTTDAIPLISQMSNDVTATRTPVPIRPPFPPKRRINYLQLAQNMMTMPTDAATQLSQTWCGQDNNPQTMLAGSNTPAEASLAAQAMAKLDQWYPGWTNQVAGGRVSLIVTDQMPLPGQTACTCVLPDSSRAYIMISRQVLTQIGPPYDPLLFMIGSLRHENFHNQSAFNDGPGHQAGPDEEANAMRTNVDVDRKAATDPNWSQYHDQLLATANYSAFYADLIQRKDIPWDVDSSTIKDLASYYAPYNASLSLFQAAHEWTSSQITYITSQRDANGNLTMVWKIPDGSQINVTSGADGTCAEFPDASGTSANRLCIKS